MTWMVAVAFSTVGWPALHLAVFRLRFDRLPPGGLLEGAVFAPMGFVAGVVAAALVTRVSSRRQRCFVGWGYLAATPIALFGSLLGGLVLPGVWGPLVFGAIPLASGCLVGFELGRNPGATA